MRIAFRVHACPPPPAPRVRLFARRRRLHSCLYPPPAPPPRQGAPADLMPLELPPMSQYLSMSVSSIHTPYFAICYARGTAGAAFGTGCGSAHGTAGRFELS